MVEVQHDAKVRLAHPAHRLHRQTMRQQDVVHGAGGGADVAQAGGVDAHEVRKPGDTPRFVYCGDAGNAVAKAAGDHFGKIGKAVAGVAVGPAALVGKGRGHFPVVKRLERFQPAREHAINQTVIKINAFRVDVHTVRQDPRP